MDLQTLKFSLLIIPIKQLVFERGRSKVTEKVEDMKMVEVQKRMRTHKKPPFNIFFQIHPIHPIS